MDSYIIAHTRLYNQQLLQSSFERPSAVVEWFGAMQAQDFAAAKWAIALRTKEQTDERIEGAFNTGDFLRTHIMRPTWHFVSPRDIRWLLELTSPRVQAFNGYYYRKSGLDKTVFEKSNKVIQKVLRGGKQFTRSELDVYLQEAHIPTKDLGLSYTIMQAELDGIICSGPRRGKQFTYMLLDERVPAASSFSRDESLAELTKRYFQSHGPAQVQDFVWWSGLAVVDAKRGLALLGSKIHKETLEGKQYWFFEGLKSRSDFIDGFLIPGFDEYFIAYTDRQDILDSAYAKQLNQGGGMINGAIVVAGRMVGGWKRILARNEVVITLDLFEQITPAQYQSIVYSVQRYGVFISKKVRLLQKGETKKKVMKIV